MNLSKKTVAMLLTGAAITAISTQASAIATTQVGALTSGGVINQTGQMQVKNWADIAVGLGWMHTTKWVEFSVDASAATGSVRINLTDTSKAYSTISVSASTGNTTINASNGNTSHPAFSLFSVGPSGFNETAAVASANVGSGVGWDQVDLSPVKKGAFLLAGGATGFVGYANSGTTFTNSENDAVGNGSAGSSYGTTGGHDWAQLDLNLAAGNYLLAIGNSCFTLTNCGNEVTNRVVLDSNYNLVSITPNPANAWNMADYKLTISSVPVPGAVWLFGSAMAGVVGLRRRKSV